MSEEWTQDKIIGDQLEEIKHYAYKLDALENLIVHCQVHSGYKDCGYNQMTTEEKELYDEILNKERE